MYLVKDLYEKHGKELTIELVAGRDGINKRIRKLEVHRPGLSLAGYFKNFVSSRILIFGKGEIDYIKQLPNDVVIERLERLLTHQTPVVIVARNFSPTIELKEICEKKRIPLFRSKMPTMKLVSKMIWLLNEEFAPKTTIHGTLVEVFGVGVLIQGESSIGKSEAALGLIERGHRLISDDIVQVVKKEDRNLIGSGPDLTRHLMEIRGIGIINVANLYGAVCVRHDKNINLIIKMEEWDDKHFYDRVGLEENFVGILGVNIPFHILPLKPGRDVILLIETIALNHRLKNMGYNSAKEFNVKLLEAISKKKKVRQAL